jgi:hypothetical protein
MAAASTVSRKLRIETTAPLLQRSKLMPNRSVSAETLQAEIESLHSKSLDDLRHQWAHLYVSPAPRALRRDLLIRAVAYQVQVKANG